MMKLADLRHTTTYFLFDPADGTVEEFQRSGDVEISGFYEQTDAGWVAIHPDPEGRTLLVQIDGTSWDLFAAETHVGYKHDYETPRTTFTIEDDEKRLRRTYDPWWDEPGCEWFEPEPWSAGREQENWEEDIFGYVWWLSQQEERKEDFVQPWAENMTGDSGDAAGEEND